MSRFFGYLLISASVLSFSLMVIVSKYLTLHSAIPAAELTFVRFLFSFLFILGLKIFFHKDTTTKNLRLLLDRGISNFVAVYLFFLAISLIPAARANLYNMTYPIFAGLIAHLSGEQKLTRSVMSSIILCFVGVWIVISPGSGSYHVALGDWVALASGVTAGYAVVSLKRASATDNAFTILYYHMGIGLIFSLLFCCFQVVLPQGKDLLPLLTMAALSLLGQYFITAAYKYLSSVQGAVWSSARIFVVAGLGAIILGDPISLGLLLGSVVILFSIILSSQTA